MVLTDARRRLLGARLTAFVACAALLSFPLTGVLAGQEEEYQAIPWSQRGSVDQRVGYTDIRIEYSRPVARGRTLFGELVHWGRIWNPGADSATTITFSRGVELEGHVLSAGAYTLWVIPREDAPWVVIFSDRTGIFHSPYPGEEHDVLRLEVEPAEGEHVETLAFYFPVVMRESAVLRLHWGETVVGLAIEAPESPYH